MTSAAQQLSQPEPNFRELVTREMSAAMKRLESEIPEADGALIVRLAIGYLAEFYARSFGHTATVKALIAIARRGLWSANEELTAPRN